MKDKLILNDGTIIEIESGASLDTIRVISDSKDSLVSVWDKFTEENLKKVEFMTSSDTLIAEYTHLVLNSVTSIEQEEGTILTTFSLREKSELELLKEEIAQQKAETYILTECLLEMSEIVYAG